MSGKANNPYPTGLAFGGAAALRLAGRVAAQSRENARRVACAHCDLTILPENMGLHLLIVHDITEDPTPC